MVHVHAHGMDDDKVMMMIDDYEGVDGCYCCCHSYCCCCHLHRCHHQCSIQQEIRTVVAVGDDDHIVVVVWSVLDLQFQLHHRPDLPTVVVTGVHATMTTFQQLTSSTSHRQQRHHQDEGCGLLLFYDFHRRHCFCFHYCF